VSLTLLLVLSAARTDPDKTLAQLRANEEELKEVNLNNIPLDEQICGDIFQALKTNTNLRMLSMSNCQMNDNSALALADALKGNSTLAKVNVESNCISPQVLVKVFEATNEQQTLSELKASNQKAQFLGHKVESAIVAAVEANTSLVKVGLHFQFGDCRDRLARNVQRNMDAIRKRRVAAKAQSANAPSSSSILAASNVRTEQTR